MRELMIALAAVLAGCSTMPTPPEMAGSTPGVMCWRASTVTTEVIAVYVYGDIPGGASISSECAAVIKPQR